MKIAVFGATGRVGRQLCELALREGHSLRILVRRKEDWMNHPQVDVAVGDAKNREDVEQVIKSVDAVFSGLGTDKTTTLSDFVTALIPAMERQSVSRIVTIGTAGILNSRTEPGVYRFQSGESNRKLTFAAEEHAKVYEALKDSVLDWTIVCPTYLPDGPITGEYRTEVDYLPLEGKQISTGDTAHFAYHILTQYEVSRARIGLAY